VETAVAPEISEQLFVLMAAEPADQGCGTIVAMADAHTLVTAYHKNLSTFQQLAFSRVESQIIVVANKNQRPFHHRIWYLPSKEGTGIL
jgi:hypothetical protein